jgi:hypothetical protein
MLVRLELSQIKHLSNVPPLGKVLALPTNDRHGWKGLPGTNTQAYYENSKITDKKGF